MGDSTQTSTTDYFFQTKFRHILLIKLKTESNEVFLFGCGTCYEQHHLVVICGE